VRPLLLVLRALKLGDFLTGLPAMRALRDCFAAHRLVLAAPLFLRPLVDLAGVADALVEADESLRPLDLTPLGRCSAGSKAARFPPAPDIAVDLHGKGPRSQPVLVSLSPRQLIAFCHEEVPETAGMPRFEAAEHEVERWCRLLREVGIPADAGRLGLPRPPRGDEGLAGATVLHPGASAPARRWPAERFAAVAAAEKSAGRRVVVTGGADELPLAREVARLAGISEKSVLAGMTDLLSLASVVAEAGRVVCGDTGLAHLATAFGRPSVVLFGPTSPASWGPPATGQHVSIWHGHLGDPHGAAIDDGLLDITIGEVIEALAALPPAESTKAPPC
jgi:ADP-heptose:LPS heptosyltransferase